MICAENGANLQNWIGGESGIRTLVLPLDSVSYSIYVVENARNATHPVEPCTLLHAGRA
jgi:hypothetical protein